LPKWHEVTATSNEAAVTEEEEIYGIKSTYQAVKTSNGFAADFVVYIAEEMIVGFIKREDSSDANVRDAYFLFGKREHNVIKGLFVGSQVHGKFYIDHEYNSSRVVIIYDNGDFRTEYYTVADNILHLRNDIVYTDRNYTTTLIRSWPDNYATDTWEILSGGNDINYFVNKMIIIQEPKKVAYYNLSMDDILYNQDMNYRQMDGMKVVLVGFNKDDNNKTIMYIRSDAKYILLKQDPDYSHMIASYGKIEYYADNKIRFTEEQK
jgi:hypothetical protein